MTNTFLVRGEIINVDNRLRRIQIREYETGIEYWADRFCWQEWDKHLNIWFEVDLDKSREECHGGDYKASGIAKNRHNI